MSTNDQNLNLNFDESANGPPEVNVEQIEL